MEAESVRWQRMAGSTRWWRMCHRWQNVGGGWLLGVRVGGSGSDGEDIYGSCGGKRCVSGS